MLAHRLILVAAVSLLGESGHRRLSIPGASPFVCAKSISYLQEKKRQEHGRTNYNPETRLRRRLGRATYVYTFFRASCVLVFGVETKVPRLVTTNTTALISARAFADPPMSRCTERALPQMKRTKVFSPVLCRARPADSPPRTVSLCLFTSALVVAAPGSIELHPNCKQ